MFIKICANTNLDDAQLAMQLGADAVGFVLAPSKRRVSSETVSEIIDKLPDHVETVGVFATDDPFEVKHHMACSGLTIAQLHRPFDADFVQTLSGEFGGKLKIIQTVAYPIDAQDRAAADAAFELSLKSVFAEPAVWAVLLDAARSGASGGLGVAFDWATVAAMVDRAAAGTEPRPRVLLAGGLTAENVAEAIATLRPWGVDVASGVEAVLGKKDPERLRAFIQAAREAGSKLES